MKLPTVLFSSLLVAILSTQIGCSSADAASTPDEASTEADLSKAGNARFADFEKDAKGLGDSMADGPDCSFVTSSAAGVLTLTVTEGKASTQLVVAASDAVTLKKRDDGATRIYTIRGKGTLTLVNADDAFISATLVLATTHKSSTCEIDF